MTAAFSPGDLVYARGREWVALPSPDEELLCLRPLSGSEADLEIYVGMRAKIRAHVLLRRARVNEVGFEIVSTDLESRYRLRRLLVEALNTVPHNKGPQWSGERKV